ncbi:hypothetical protein O9H85_02475 [Paenibacillus filicis]|uniref:Uncharacterized protein n=1 Tax=Paenibacillus gyeongsangnamensis TaxID=3388067 RepID=A0ABT4Q366_9BACL|nr:hypothetical protein [Paenibacillus filicis]MCZ8511320.1 hypothetical protein [Paenibacillus filicis]
MVHTKVKTYKHKIGKNQYLVIQIFQSAVATAHTGNALASNAVNVKIFKSHKKR